MNKILEEFAAHFVVLDFVFCRIGYETIIAGSLLMLFDWKLIHIVPFADYLVCVAVRCQLLVNGLTDHDSFG